jgi:hypothetical protein
LVIDGARKYTPKNKQYGSDVAYPRNLVCGRGWEQHSFVVILVATIGSQETPEITLITLLIGAFRLC